MGMSHDLEVAIEEGATWVRVGTALFGSRRPLIGSERLDDRVSCAAAGCADGRGGLCGDAAECTPAIGAGECDD